MDEATKADLLKVGALIFDARKRLLIVKPKKNDFWLFVGGKIEPEETFEECLAREIREELGVELAATPIFYGDSPIEPAAGDRLGRTVQIAAYIVTVQGTPLPSAEIEALHWLSADDYYAKMFLLGSILDKYFIPRLIAEGKIE